MSTWPPSSPPSNKTIDQMNPALVRPGPPSLSTEVVIPINQMPCSSETMAFSHVVGSFWCHWEHWDSTEVSRRL